MLPAKILNRLISITFQPWMVSLALLGSVLLAYGIYIPWFGLYGDDWIYLYAYHVGGPTFFIPFVAWDRPFSAWIYLVTTPLFGENVWMYHAFLLVLRWLSALLVWKVLRVIWPDDERLPFAVAMLFSVYPGFKQQPLPLEFILHFSSLVFFLLSIYLMLYVVNRPRHYWPLTGLSLLCAWFGIFPIEYYVGLELLRPVLLWILLARSETQWRTRLVKTLKNWALYLGMLLVFLYWRVFVFGFPSYKTVSLSGTPLDKVMYLAGGALADIRTVLLSAWGAVFSFPEWNSSTARFYALVIIAFGLAWLLFSAKFVRADSKETLAANHDGFFAPLLVGIFGLVVAGVPFWSAEIPVKLEFPWDRPSLSFMWGVSLVMVSLVFMLVKLRYQALVLAVLFGLAVGSHYQNARFYNIEWLNANSFFWQLKWRAPGLKPGTILLFHQLRLNTVSDNDLTPALNWMYVPERRSADLLYKIFDLDLRWRSQYVGLSDMSDGIPVEHINRSLRFSGNTSNALAVYYNSSACLRILQEGDELLPGITDLLRQALPISHVQQILPEAQPVDFPEFMQPEPPHTWCYYFQKADLARQQKDWQQVIIIGEEAFAKTYSPVDKTELFPLIEAYAHTGNSEKASDLTIGVAETDTAYRPALCALWNTLARDSSIAVDVLAEIPAIKIQAGCQN